MKICWLCAVYTISLSPSFFGINLLTHREYREAVRCSWTLFYHFLLALYIPFLHFTTFFLDPFIRRYRGCHAGELNSDTKSYANYIFNTKYSMVQYRDIIFFCLGTVSNGNEQLQRYNNINE